MPKLLQHEQKSSRHMFFHGAFRDPQPLGDLALGKPIYPPQGKNITNPPRQGGNELRQAVQFLAVDHLALGRRLVAGHI